MSITKIIHTSSFKGPYILAGFRKKIDTTEFINIVYEKIFHSNPFYINEKERINSSIDFSKKRVKKHFTFSVELNNKAYNLTDVKSSILSPALRFIFFEGLKKDLIRSDDYIIGIDFEEQFNPFGSPKSRILLLAKLQEIFEILKPVYIFGDSAHNINKTTGKDPRQYCWNYNYFSPELINQIGRECQRRVNFPHFRRIRIPHLYICLLVLTSIPFLEWHSHFFSTFQSVAFAFEVESDTVM